jgi:hypothetical protein
VRISILPDHYIESVKYFLHIFVVITVLVPAGLVLTIDTLASEQGGRAEYMGGTVSSVKERSEGRIQTMDDIFLVFRSQKGSIRIPYEKINLLEYGQKVNRRLGMAIVISPMFLLSKQRKHFLTIGYADEEGRQQAMVFQIDKGDVRSVLASLEARTGRKVQYQDEEARKAGKG